jgi:multicomponent Na+:H+ antiporter subunit D
VTSLVPLPVVLPLAGAALSLLLSRRRTAQRVLGMLVTGAVLVISLVLLYAAHTEGVVVMQVGGWEAPLGITLIVDRLSGIMLSVSMLVVFAVLTYALGQLDADRETLYFHPLYLVLTAGVCASFVTGDLFNLFVAFEIMLIASYVLITLGGTRRQLRAGMTYVVINVVASTLFVTAVSFVYASTGTVNMAQLALRVSEIPDGLRTGLGLLLLVVFGIKAGLFPLFFWLPDSYPTAPAPVTAVFAGLLTKVGVYAIIRTQTLIFPTDGSPSTLLLFVAGATMFVGVLGAIAQNDVKRILSFHIISQIGYMILGLGLFTVAGLAGGILYIVHHIVVKTALFLVSGILETSTGTGALDRLGGLAKRLPAVAVMFGIAALSLAGLPPFSGFVAKLSLVQAGLDAERYLVVGVSLLVSLLTLYSMTKIWANAFWGPSTGDLPMDEAARRTGDGQLAMLRTRPLTVLGTGLLVAASVAISLGAAPLYRVTEQAADDLLERDAYITSVLSVSDELASR